MSNASLSDAVKGRPFHPCFLLDTGLRWQLEAFPTRNKMQVCFEL